ncbi:hypothetical protein GCM10010502_63380 [Kitasatospora aureofaciens]|uniref:Uncharacterized protein n=1 Tax=Kitasatospora aureofaciens TaxID=1894 RepID=A0A8H9HXY5_KITAU|nr:hypothetical protein GCM10010502_63380 [Kitasatospora aureofaciens]
MSSSRVTTGSSPSTRPRRSIRSRIRASSALEASGCTLHEAIDIFGERYEQLRCDRPDDFQVSREEYGRNVYT